MQGHTGHLCSVYFSYAPGVLVLAGFPEFRGISGLFLQRIGIHRVSTSVSQGSFVRPFPIDHQPRLIGYSLKNLLLSNADYFFIMRLA